MYVIFCEYPWEGDITSFFISLVFQLRMILQYELKMFVSFRKEFTKLMEKYGTNSSTGSGRTSPSLLSTS